ncbi:MAG: hypothetical protein AVDCRST_MAG50-1858 [uncultured Acidimicrobiales bacterium]|uniref:MarR family transcriptional regulator n=1 Tax=uncultured Acidimicrobiales bacterium TaxID=310071 RepID=A0A6J4I4Y4_9ACTN|nr:MAG: hypothetical protein AVDCRST_MAG50-1858 [uncultured Acidimicrobiales bacterium]
MMIRSGGDARSADAGGRHVLGLVQHVRVLAAAWREALMAVAEGVSAPEARAAIELLSLDEGALSHAAQ